jgi:HEAT repeat protein
MKKLLFAMLIVSLIMFSNLSYAKGKVSPTVSKINNYELIELNLLNGLENENTGLKSSSAFLLGEFKSEKSVIPLMRVLRNNVDPSLRIMAALALYKIGDARGIWAVKQASRFDDNECVRKKCNQFYTVYAIDKEKEEN